MRTSDCVKIVLGHAEPRELVVHTSKTTIDVPQVGVPQTMITASLVVPTTTKRSPSHSPPNLGRKTSLVDLKDWVVDDGPTSPKAMANNVLAPAPLIDLHSPPKPKPNPKPKPANLSSKPPQLPPRKSPSHSSLRSSQAATPQLNFLYPPRRQDSLSVEQPHPRSSSHAHSSSASSFHSVSLSSDTDTTAGSLSNFVATFPVEKEHSWSSATHDADSLSLTESYENVSASSALASPATVERIEWQYETRKPNLPPKLPNRPPIATKPSSFTRNSNLKASPPSHPSSLSRSPSIASGSVPSSPVTLPSLSRHSSVSTLNNASVVPPYSPYTPRRAAPPPPPPPSASRSSDRSSILSSTTSHSLSSLSSSSHSLPLNTTLRAKRPTPVPLAARKRYEALFFNNVAQRNKMLKVKEKRNANAQLSPPEPRNRRAAGWRGLSVDLITGVEELVGLSSPPGDNEKDDSNIEKTYQAIGTDEKLEGAIVKLIWKKSGLESMRLAEIWYVKKKKIFSFSKHFRSPFFLLSFKPFLLYCNLISQLTGTNAILHLKAHSPSSPSSKACGASTRS